MGQPKVQPYAWPSQPCDIKIWQRNLPRGTGRDRMGNMMRMTVALAAVFLIYKLTHFLGRLTSVLPNIFEEFNSLSNSLHDKFSAIIPQEYTSTFDDLSKGMFEEITTSVSGFVSGTLTKLAKNTPSFLFGSIVALVASCYIAKDYDGLLKFVKELCGKKITNNLEKIKVILFESVFKLLKGYLILTLLYLELLVKCNITGLMHQ